MLSPSLRGFKPGALPAAASYRNAAAVIDRRRMAGALVGLVGNGKGGCGKSTVVVNTAVGFARQGKRVLVIDGDSEQQTVVKWGRPAVAGNPEVVSCEPATIIETLARKIDDVDVVLIDLPGRDVHVLAQVLDVADILISPAKPSRQDLSELGRFIRAARARQCPHIVVFNETTRETTEEIARLRVEFAEFGPFLPIAIQQISSYRRIYAYGRGVLEIRPPDPARANFEKVFAQISAAMKRAHKLRVAGHE